MVGRHLVLKVPEEFLDILVEIIGVLALMDI